MREQSVDLNGQDEAIAMVREKPDGTIDPAGEAGWYLQRERESRLETLVQAGDSTGIHPYHLEAIEYGDLTHMPERLDALEMVGVYAEYLGFDPEPLVEHYAQFLPAPELAPKSNHPANPAPLSSAKVLKFGQLPKMPKIGFKLNGVPGGAGGLVASLAGAVFLFAGISFMLMPGADEPLAQSQQVAGTVNPGADPMPSASTVYENAEITNGEEPLRDDQQLAAAAAPTATARVGWSERGAVCVVARAGSAGGRTVVWSSRSRLAPGMGSAGTAAATGPAAPMTVRFRGAPAPPWSVVRCAGTGAAGTGTGSSEAQSVTELSKSSSKTSRTWPILISSPCLSIASPRTRSPLMYVPFRLPRSRRTNDSPRCSRMQCSLETILSRSWMELFG